MRRGQPRESAAVFRRNTGMLHRNAAHVQFEDDRLFPRDLRPAVLTPSESGFDNLAFRNETGVVASVERQIVAFGSDAISENGIVPTQFALEHLSVGIEQQLVRVESMPPRRVVGAVHSIAV